MTMKPEKDKPALSGADELEQNVRRRCNAQIPIEEIAAMYECSVELLEKRFGERLEVWRKEGRGQARQELFWSACSGKISALIFFLKSFCGLSDGSQGESEDLLAKYKAKLRSMSDAELHEEIERQKAACGVHSRGTAAGGGGRS